jgi:hypothetical protein
MRQQSNTPLYIVGGCVLAVAAIVAVVRANAPPEEAKKPGSSLANLRITSGDPAGQALPPTAGKEGMDGEEGEGRVQMLPITVDGMQGLLIRYQADVIFEPIQQNVARNILNSVRKEAEKVGVEVIVVMAVGPTGDAGTALPPQTHTLAFRRLIDGSWVDMEAPKMDLEGAPELAPAGSSSATPTGSNVPLFIPH